MLITAVAGAVGDRAPAALQSSASRRLGDPFTLGVASGEPTADGFVLWTRLAPEPLADDGRGGMPDRDVAVQWQLSLDETFTQIVARGEALARRAYAHSVHLELGGLQPGREYFYRFRHDSHVSPVGRTRTAPAWNVFGPPITMAIASCAHYEFGYFTAYRSIAAEDPDVVLHLGDYIYEGGGDDVPTGAVRHHAGPETTSLAAYRRRHAQYKTDPDLQAAHAAAPWIVVFDDHEVDNDWADDRPGKPEPGFRRRRAAAMRAYFENLPLRWNTRPRGAHMQLYRRLTWGQLARFHMLDTRQYRSDQPCDGHWGTPGCKDLRDPRRDMLGSAQERWLLDGIRTSPAAWNVLGQQVPMLVRDIDPGPDRMVPVDGWDGYPAARARLLRQLRPLTYKNPLVLTGDAHMHMAGELHVDAENPETPRVGVEVCTSSVTSGGDGSAETPHTASLRSENAALHYADARRGYVRARLAPERLELDYRVLPYVSRRGATTQTSASYVVEYGRPVLHDTGSGINPV